MAIWQYDFYIIPEYKYNNSNHKKSFDELVDNINWAGHNINNESINNISHVLKPSKSWSDDIKQLGDNESTCIQIFYENDILDSIRIRLDLRNLSNELIEKILTFIKVNNALIVTNNHVINPVVNELLYELRVSNTYKFVKDPIDFFNNF